MRIKLKRSGRNGVCSSRWRTSPSISRLPPKRQPEFRQVDLDGRYVFFVFERFALRIKDANAIGLIRGHWGTTSSDNS